MTSERRFESGSPVRSGDRHNETVVPFARLFHSLLVDVRAQLHSQAGSAISALSSNAQSVLEHSLLRLLAAVCGQVLELQFSLFRLRHGNLVTRFGQSLSGHDLYDRFVDEMLDRDLEQLFAEYPGLERLVGVCLHQWINATSEFLRRLWHDRPAIESLFSNGRNPGAVIDLETDMSDRHDCGRTVMVVQFTSGLRLVYKPKDVGLEETYFAILDWFNQNGAPFNFHTLRVLKRDGYGWVEFAEHRSCDSSVEAERYYQRAGQLLCLVHVFAGTDCHFDNLIACGEYPVLVDTEMLFQPGLAEETSADSLMRTGLLPRPTARLRDFSGLGCVSEQGTQFLIPEWRGANSDAMTLRFREARLRPRANVPMLGGVPLLPFNYVRTMGDGFRRMYRYLLANKQQLLRPDGPLAKVAVEKVRMLVRGTLEYYVVISQILHPKRLRASGCPEIKFKCPARFPQVEDCEFRALRQMDVPRFLLEASKRSFATTDGTEVSATFVQSGFEHVISQIESLSEPCLEQHVKLIEFAWAFAALSQISPEGGPHYEV